MIIKEVQIRPNIRPSIMPAEVVNNSTKYLSSVFKYRSPLIPFDRNDKQDYELEKTLLSQVLGIDKNAPEFTKEIHKYWVEYRIPVPVEGVEINASLDDNGNPINIPDYIKYRFALAHPLVAMNKSEADQNFTKEFYIYDPSVEINEAYQTSLFKKEAYKALLNMEPNKKVFVIRVLSPSAAIHKMSTEEKENYLIKMLDSNPREFVKVAGDPLLEAKFFIYELTSAGIVRNVNGTYLYNETVMGQSIETAIAWINEPRNTQLKAEMKAKYKNITGTEGKSSAKPESPLVMYNKMMKEKEEIEKAKQQEAPIPELAV